MTLLACRRLQQRTDPALAQLRLTDSASDDLDHVVTIGKAAGEPLRVGILQVLREESYSVSELCELFAVAQPALSHHLKILHQAGLVAKRREGNSIFYRRACVPGRQSQQDLYLALLKTIDQASLAPAIVKRAAQIYAARRARSEEFFTCNATQFTAQQARICEPAIYTDTVKDILEKTGIVDKHKCRDRHALEVGPGDGHLLAWLAETFEQVTGIDSSAGMLEKARQKTLRIPRVSLSHCDFMELPVPSSFHLIIAAMVIHHLASPAAFFQQARRLLESDGVLIIAELCRHDQQWANAVCGDQWLGFEPRELNQWALRVGFHTIDSQFLAQKNGFRIQIHCYHLTNSTE